MKQAVFLLFVFYSFYLSAQRCTTPVAPAIFQQNFNQVAMLRSDAAKQSTAVSFVNANCVSSLQVKSMAMLFTSDSVRLIFCKAAYPRVTDTAEFFAVYDAFQSFSYAIRLYDYAQHYKPVRGDVVITPRPVPPVPVPTAPAGPVFPSWQYPDTLRRAANKGCAGPVIGEGAFTAIADNVFRQPTEESKIVAIESASANNCLSVAQVMKLSSMLTGEDNRMRVMKNTFPRVYDQEHYTSAAVAFTTPQKQSEWNAFGAAYLTPPCVVSEAAFGPLLQQIKSKTFPADRLALVKDMAKDRCFNTAQLKQISDQFTFDDERMEIFKLCYAQCPDKQNYYILVDQLSFTSKKDELRRFINGGGK
jgi:hypothetical protein